mgnify:CR=1 FL=1|jgi:hypothetical protein
MSKPVLHLLRVSCSFAHISYFLCSCISKDPLRIRGGSLTFLTRKEFEQPLMHILRGRADRVLRCHVHSGRKVILQLVMITLRAYNFRA